MSSPQARWPPFAQLRGRLEAAGFRPSRRLGQNFMIDPQLAAAIVRDAGVESGEFVLEVGPGPGVLTFQLARAGARVLAVEIDPRLAAVAAENLGGAGEVELLECDVLAGKHALAPEVEAKLPAAGEPWRLVANLPYSVSAPLIAILAARGASAPLSMTCLVQREVAQRLAAMPASADWGPLAIGVQLAYEAQPGRTVGPELFWPRPKVDSTVCHLALRSDAPTDPAGLAAAERVRALARALFGRRRQTLGRFVAEHLPPPDPTDGAAGSAPAREGARRERAAAWTGALGLDPAARPETLDLAALRRLAEALAAAGAR